MLTSRAISGFERLLTRCMSGMLNSGAGNDWEVTPVPDPGLKGPPEVVMLTVSSYDFQLIVLLHFASDQPSMQYATQTLDISHGELSLSRYQDFLCEMGNTFCGALKRELGVFIPHLGMSTPNILARESLKYLQAMAIDHQYHLKASAPIGATFYGSLYILAPGQLDFDYREAHAENESREVGELELF